jgi:hypothetical protein
MTAPTQPSDIWATMTNLNLIGEDAPYAGTVLTGPGRIMNGLANGHRVKVRVVDGKVTEVLKDAFAEQERQKREEKAGHIEEFAKLLRTHPVNPVFDRSARKHFDGDPTADFAAVLRSGEYHVADGTTDTTFKLIIDRAGPSKTWLVAGTFAVTSKGLNLTIEHYGPGAIF